MTVGGNSYFGGNIYVQGSATTTDSLFVGGYASSTLGLLTQGSGHYGGTLTVDGSVGIGTTTPQSNLSISGTTGIRLDYPSSDIPGYLNVSDLGGLFYSSNVNPSDAVASTTKPQWRYFFSQRDDAFGIQRSPAGTTWPPADLFRISSTGNVGIGITSPTSTLDILGTLNVSSNATTSGRLVVGSANPTNNYGNLWVGAGTGAAYFNGGVTTTDSFYSLGFASTTLGLFTQGNLGVGGTLRVDGNATTSSRLVVGSTNPTNNFGKLWVGGDIYSSGSASTTGSLYVGGQVGIGSATNIVGKLTVNSLAADGAGAYSNGLPQLIIFYCRLAAAMSVLGRRVRNRHYILRVDQLELEV